MAIAEVEYFEQRLDDQINWYDKKSVFNQIWYKSLRLAEIVFATSIPLLAGYTQVLGYETYVGLAIGAIGLIVAVLAGVMSLYWFQDNWNEYRASAEALKQKKYLYLARVEPYDGKEPCVEALLKSETTDWAQAMRATASTV